MRIQSKQDLDRELKELRETFYEMFESPYSQDATDTAVAFVTPEVRQAIQKYYNVKDAVDFVTGYLC